MRPVIHDVGALIGLLCGAAAVGSQTYLIEELPGRALKAWSVGIDSHDNLYVADAINHRIDRFARARRDFCRWVRLTASLSSLNSGEHRASGRDRPQ